MNKIIEKIVTRHAIRRFQDKQVSEAALEEIITAGLYAPSAGNRQYSRIVVCQDKEVNLKLGKISRYMQFKGADPQTMSHFISADQPSIQDDFTIMDGFYGAPTVITIFTQDSRYSHDDAAMIGENIMLAAHFLGIGSCYIGRAKDVFNTEYGMRIRKEWGVPDDLVAVSHVILGYSKGPTPGVKARKEGRVIRV